MKHAALLLAVVVACAAEDDDDVADAAPAERSHRHHRWPAFGTCKLLVEIDSQEWHLDSDACRRTHGGACEEVDHILFQGVELETPLPLVVPREGCFKACTYLAKCAGATFHRYTPRPGVCDMHSESRMAPLRRLPGGSVCRPTTLSGRRSCDTTRGFIVGTRGDLGSFPTLSDELCCARCGRTDGCVAASYFTPAPSCGRGACDPARCHGWNVNTSDWYCTNINTPQCANLSMQAGPPCQPPGWLPCPGTDSHHGPPPHPGDQCGCRRYSSGVSTDQVLCVNHGRSGGGFPGWGAVCGLPDADGDCAATETRCAPRTVPRLLLRRKPAAWRDLLSAVGTAANTTLEKLRVISLCPSKVCERGGCPGSLPLRFQAGCVSDTANISALGDGGVVFDFDVTLDDNKTRGDALSSFFAAAMLASNTSSNQSAVNATQGARQLQALGAQGFSLDAPPAQHTAAPSPPSSTPFSSGVFYTLIGVGCVVVLIVGAAVRRVRWSGDVDFAASRSRRRGMEGCMRAHGGRRQAEVNIDRSNDDDDDDEWQAGAVGSHSTSSSDSEPEIDI